MKIYGIKNCTTVKKALGWLDNHQIAYEFYDFKKSGADARKLQEWIAQLGLEKVMNKRSATWKTIPAQLQQAAIVDNAVAIKLMQEKTSLIKRPLLETTEGIILGFDEQNYSKMLS